MQFKKIHTKKEIEQVSALAKTIWTEYYTDLLPQGQAAYMIEKFQSVEPISIQISEGHQYYFIQEEKEAVGYFDFLFKGDECFISKIYLLSTVRGKGLGKDALKFIEERAKQNGFLRLTLTVNKNNIQAINAYLRADFQNVGPVQIDIGNGFKMDDFKMEKVL